MKIHYAQCWEDPRPLEGALEVTAGDDVISIGSGGDNTFALLLNQPHSLTAIDRDAAQISLLELKMRAIERLDYDRFVGFVGARPYRERERLYGLIRPSLSDGAKMFWDHNTAHLRKGIIHYGKFETYFRIFRKFVLPLVHSRETVQRLLAASSLAEQRLFYSRVWNNGRWQRLFRIFFGKFLLGHLGRDPSYFRYVRLDKVADVLHERARHALTEIPIRDNYYLEYILTGKNGHLEVAHPYLQPSNFPALKNNLGRLNLVCADLKTHLKSLPPESVSKFNLSDIFEYLSDAEVESHLREIRRVSRPGAKLAFWTLFIPRPLPPALKDQIVPSPSWTEKLFFDARTFFYGSFCSWQVSG